MYEVHQDIERTTREDLSPWPQRGLLVLQRLFDALDREARGAFVLHHLLDQPVKRLGFNCHACHRRSPLVGNLRPMYNRT